MKGKVNLNHLMKVIKIINRHKTALQSKNRTLDSVLSCATSKTLGVVHTPLINIEINKVKRDYDNNTIMLPILTSQIIIDELHLFLRVFDVLLRNLIFATLTADSGIMRDTTFHMDKLVEMIRVCGVTFRVSTLKLLQIRRYSETDLEVKRRK